MLLKGGIGRIYKILLQEAPSVLLLGWVEGEPFHVVTALDSESGCCFIITAYKPDLEHFEPDYKTRRQHGN